MDVAAFDEHVESICRAPDAQARLTDLLFENSELYEGLSTGEAERIRGFVLARFEKIGLPNIAIPYVIEELETGLNPYTVAAAAKAARGAAETSERMLALLASAAQRLASSDDLVQYETLAFRPRCANQTSVMAEIIRTLAAAMSRAQPYWRSIHALADRGQLSPAALKALSEAQSTEVDGSDECCCAEPPRLALPAARVRPSQALADLLVEDQSGATFRYGDFLRGRVSIVTFFYTRCMNPQKCSLTISKIARLQRSVDSLGLSHFINICAITYDPAYDGADRLRLYGADRGFRFNDRNRLIRTVGPFNPIQDAFGTNVGFGPATVNRHSVELLILRPTFEVAREFRRVQWSEDEVVAAIQQVMAEEVLEIKLPGADR